MTQQEQEHWDHVAGSASEFQNCYTEARAVCGLKQSEQAHKINDALDQGLFVVIDEQPYYCRATDAIAGTVRYLRGAFPTRPEANAAAERIANAECEFGDGSISVLPMPELPPKPVVEATDSENVPF